MPELTEPDPLLSPVSYDGGGNPWYAEPPIHHRASPNDHYDSDADDWDECPKCGDPLVYTPTHDSGQYGAVPDYARCDNCDYQWSDG